MPASRFHGIYPMLFALFAQGGSLDRAAMKRQVDAMVRVGAHGIAVLGLATESNKLSFAERCTLLQWVAEDLDGRLPLSVTIPGPNAIEQVELARQAKSAGAKWLILQPPPVTAVPEAALVRYFSEVVVKVDLPVGLQIAPEYLGNAISAAAALDLARQHPQLNLLKVEMTGHDVARLVAKLGHHFAIFNGQDGLDLPDSFRGGCAGCIPGAEFADVLVRIFNGLASDRPEDRAAADRLYIGLMPILSFLMRSMDQFLVYGKRILCRRLDLPEANTLVRSPASAPDAAGEAIVEHWSRAIGKIGL